MLSGDNNGGDEKVATPTNCHEVNNPAEEINDEPEEFFIDPEEARRGLEKLIGSQGDGIPRNRAVPSRRRKKPATKQADPPVFTLSTEETLSLRRRFRISEEVELIIPSSSG